MCDTGRNFKKRFSSTPATAVTALKNWDVTDCQSVFYDSKNYTANIMRVDGKVFIRAFYLFDDSIMATFEISPCTTFDAIYENMPIVDTFYQKGDTNDGYGIILDDEATPFTAAKTDEEELTISWNDKSIVFKNNSILINNCQLSFAYSMVNTKIDVNSNYIDFEYKSHKYRLNVTGAEIKNVDGMIKILGNSVILTPVKL